MPTEREFLRHKCLYRAARFLCPVLLHKYSYKTDVMEKMSEPTIVLANHLTESDMLMVASAFRQHVYFVSGEHLLRSRLGPIIRRIADPIAAPRGGNMLGTVKEILKRIRQGYSVAMFPEGSRSFHGETLPVEPATAKLIKRAGCGLVTYRIHGGYFIAPRWAYFFRRGHAEGEIVRVYSSQELRTMSVEELTKAINRDLFENAYCYQSRKRYRYQSGHLAEGLENYLIICPQCGAYDTMETKGDHFRCTSCGLGGIYDEYGMLQGDALPFHTVYDWGRWMEKRFYEDVRAAEREVLFCEQGVRLYEILPEHRVRDIAEGDLHIRRGSMELIAGEKHFCFPFDGITEKSLLYYGKTILFTDASGYYGLTGERFHAWKLDQLMDYARAEQRNAAQPSSAE